MKTFLFAFLLISWRNVSGDRNKAMRNDKTINRSPPRLPSSALRLDGKWKAWDVSGELVIASNDKKLLKKVLGMENFLAYLRLRTALVGGILQEFMVAGKCHKKFENGFSFACWDGIKR